MLPSTRQTAVGASVFSPSCDSFHPRRHKRPFRLDRTLDWLSTKCSMSSIAFQALQRCCNCYSARNVEASNWGAKSNSSTALKIDSACGVRPPLQTSAMMSYSLMVSLPGVAERGMLTGIYCLHRLKKAPIILITSR